MMSLTGCLLTELRMELNLHFICFLKITGLRWSGFAHKNTVRVCGGMYILLERIRITKGSQMDTCQRRTAQSIRIAPQKIASLSFSAPYKLDVTKVIAF